jgi:hypothetical protein
MNFATSKLAAGSNRAEKRALYPIVNASGDLLLPKDLLDTLTGDCKLEITKTGGQFLVTVVRQIEIYPSVERTLAAMSTQVPAAPETTVPSPSQERVKTVSFKDAVLKKAQESIVRSKPKGPSPPLSKKKVERPVSSKINVVKSRDSTKVDSKKKTPKSRDLGTSRKASKKDFTILSKKVSEVKAHAIASRLDRMRVGSSSDSLTDRLQLLSPSVRAVILKGSEEFKEYAMGKSLTGYEQASAARLKADPAATLRKEGGRWIFRSQDPKNRRSSYP